MAFAKQFLQDKHYQMIIAADAGLEILKKLNLMPDEIVGDLDSVAHDILKEYKNNKKVAMDIHKAEKDETDTELALMAAAKYGYNQVDLLGALGGRMDHALSNIQLLSQFYKQGLFVNIYDEKNRIYLLGKGKTFHRENLYGTYISFLPVSGMIEGLTLKGFKYPLNHRRIPMGSSLCISNELTGDIGIMDLDQGVVLCVESHD